MPKSLNVADIINISIAKNPYFQIILTNLISCELKDNSLYLKFPDILPLKALFNLLQNSLKTDLKNNFDISLIYDFYDFNLPFLPYPAQSSKHNNMLLFVFPNFSYTVLKKKEFFSIFDNGEKAKSDEMFNFIGSFDNCKLYDLLKDLFLEHLPILRQEWRYFHTILPFYNFETMFIHNIIVENVHHEIEEVNKIKDVKRFIGKPCFTLINYESIVKESL